MTKTRELPELSPPSKTELALLSVLWKEGQSTGKEVHEAMVQKQDLPKSVAYTTVLTYLDRLIHKGYAKKEKVQDDSRGAYAYEAIVTREEVMVQHEVLEHVVDSLHLTPSAMVRWFDARQKLTPEEIAELKKFVEENEPSS